jgi:antitoxin (DNA-binding transcriptional repressor) of toxin-antitoxin stability system
MEEVGVRELRQQASRYLRRVAAGESFTITDYGKPVAILAATMEAVRAESEAVIQRLVDAGVYASMGDAIADDTKHLAEQARQRVIGEAIVAGYRRHPQADREVGVAREAGRRAIAAEPW